MTQRGAQRHQKVKPQACFIKEFRDKKTLNTGNLNPTVYIYIYKKYNDDDRFNSGIQRWFNIMKSVNITHHINRLKKKNIVSVDAKKKKDKAPPPIMIKISSKQ